MRNISDAAPAGWPCVRVMSVLAAASLAVAGAAVAAPSAFAEPTDGTLSVRVVEDRNINGTRDADDAALDGVQVRITDVSGTTITRTTDDDGLVTLAPSDNTLVGGSYRVEVVNPQTSRLTEAVILDGRTEPDFAPAVSFVNLAAGSDTEISVGYVDYTVLGPEGARLYSAIQPDDVWPSGETTEAYGVPYSLQPGTITDLTGRGTMGSVYGVGLDDESYRLYYGAYAKRGALYGPAGPGGLYRVNPFTGASELYVTVPDAGETAHDIGPLTPEPGVLVHQDFEFRSAVGRESLGDVEVSEDNQFLTVVNMHTDSLVVYPVIEGTNPTAIQTLAVAPPQPCAADWAPMALTEHEGYLYVGAVCGADTQAYVIQYERSTDGSLAATGMVRQGDVSLTDGRAGQKGPNLGINAQCDIVDWRPWVDDAPQICIDSAASADPIDPAANGLAGQWVLAQPMLADMEFLDNGELVLSFRDRGGDQYGSLLYYGERTNGTSAYSNYIATGDLVALPGAGTTLDFANPVHDFNDFAGFHNQAAFGGITAVPTTGTIVSNQMDATGLFMNGLRSFNADTGATARNAFVTDDFEKSQGLADLEALVLDQVQQIGNRVWLDLNQNGSQDGGENPVAGVQVGLYDEEGNLVATTETDALGEYYFDTSDGLLPETDYQIRLDRPADFEEGGPLFGYDLTSTNTGSDAYDNDASLGDGTSAPDQTPYIDVTTPPAGRNDHSFDFGFVPPLVSIGDFVWIDADRDGVQDPGEDPVAGVTVRLLDLDGNEVATSVTDGDGYYWFDDLPAGTDYLVEFPTSVEVGGVEYPLTEPNAGGDDAADSDADPATGRVPVTTPAGGDNLTGGEVTDDPTIDAGYVPPLVSIGDFVWVDSDDDGIQDADEDPVPGVTVRLLDPDGNELASTETDENGYYVFPDLPINTDVIVEFPTDLVVDGVTYPLTEPNRGGDDAADSDADPGTGRVSVTTPSTGSNSVEPGEADVPTIDAGYVPPLVSIGDFVWIDADRDGVQDPGEDPVAGVTVRLLDLDGNEVATSVTDGDGYYWFDDLPAGTDFLVEFPTSVPVDGVEYPLTEPNAGGDDAADSDADPATGRVPVTTPTGGDNLAGGEVTDDPTIDAGYVPPLVSIGDYVWIDTDRDGVQDPGEHPVPGVTVRLLDPDGNELASTETDENGYYVFPDLPINTDVIVEFPTTVEIDGVEHTLTDPDQGADDGADSDADPSTGRVSVTTPSTGSNSVEPGEADIPTIDAGFVPPLVSIGDFVWIDADRDGVQDAGEDPVPGVTVRLLDLDGNEVATSVTDGDGYYWFDDLPAGTDYLVEFPTSVEVGGATYPLTEPNLGGDDAADSDADPATGRVPVTTPTGGDNQGGGEVADDPTIDAGYVPPLVSIGDYVWVDTDDDGVQDPGEDPVPGVTVRLLDPDGNELASTETDEDGYYAFTDLEPGIDVIVEFPTRVTLNGSTYLLTSANAGGDDAADSDADPGTGQVRLTTPLTGSNSAAPGEADNPTIDAGYVFEAALPSTGIPGDAAALAGVAALLLAAGLVLVMARRRRTT